MTDRLNGGSGELRDDMSFDEIDEFINPRPGTCDFDAIVDRALSRRAVLGGVFSFGSVVALAGMPALTPLDADAAVSAFDFDAVPAGTSDTLTLPKGYSARTLVSWGDPLWSNGAEFDPASRGDAASQAHAFGDNNDGMWVFVDGDRHILVANNEYTNRKIIWGNRPEGKPANDDDIAKGKAAHGVSVVEIRPGVSGWEVVKDSPVNRRITPDTVMDITGPARGHELMKTAADPDGTTTLGTWNNCGNGRTPWGTYLACEENFNGYFSSENEDYKVSSDLKRYGISARDWGYRWSDIDDRFDIAKYPNEPNRAGYVVEIDPRDPTSTPRKLTALGRFKHENAELVVNGDGRIVIYMGDDERGEFLYKYVSDGVYSDQADTNALLENGTLYSAQFLDDGRGEWLPLSPKTTGMTKAEICIHTRQAASIVGATTMDRPEWVAANPLKAEVYCALTNNKHRGRKPNRGGDPTPVGGPNPREANRYGQIVRWWPGAADHASDHFMWDLFVLAGNPSVHDDDRAGSTNLTTGNMFNSPDGIHFDSKGRLWIQTDGNSTNEDDFAGHGNNQMLVGDPVSGEIRRFLVGPKDAEITGLTWSSDRKTMFVGVQHPGSRGNSHWPGGGDSVPRSSIVAVTRDDGGIIG